MDRIDLKPGNLLSHGVARHTRYRHERDGSRYDQQAEIKPVPMRAEGGESAPGSVQYRVKLIWRQGGVGVGAKIAARNLHVIVHGFAFRVFAV